MKAKWIKFTVLELLFTISGIYLIPINLYFGIGFWIVLSGVLLYGTIREKNNNISGLPNHKENKLHGYN